MKKKYQTPMASVITFCPKENLMVNTSDVGGNTGGSGEKEPRNAYQTPFDTLPSE